MTVKEFFKSTAFKCIAVLTCVLLISGVLLAICWGFLEVTDDERFNRKIGTVYGGETVTATEQDLSGKNVKVNNATIQKMWYIEEKNDYLVQAASRGYNGDITCWIAVNMQDNKKDVKGLGKVILYAVGDPAELTGNISSNIYDKFPAEYTEGKTFTYGTEGTDEFIKTNASYTMTAICNDVNGAVAFVKAYASGEGISGPFAGYQYTDYLDETTKFEVKGTTVEYSIVTQGEIWGKFEITIHVAKDGGVNKITKYEIVKNGSSVMPDKDYGALMSPTALALNGKTLDEIKGYIALNDETGDDVINTGATISNCHCYYAAAFALANYDKIISEKGGN